jgi:hypothetical protein
MIQIGVDFGGTKIEAAALNPEGAFLARIRAPNPGSCHIPLPNPQGDEQTAPLGSYVFSDTWATKLVAARWGDSSGVRGASLWPIQ